MIPSSVLVVAIRWFVLTWRCRIWNCWTRSGDITFLDEFIGDQTVLDSRNGYKRISSSSIIIVRPFVPPCSASADGLLSVVVTKPRRLGKYLISRRVSNALWCSSHRTDTREQAVPLELISLTKTSFTDPPVPRSTGFHLRAALGSSSHPSPASASLAASDATLVYPITFRQIGRYGGTVSYYVDSANARKMYVPSPSVLRAG